MKKAIDYLLKNWIAIIALIISLGLLYKDYLQPFEVDVQPAGRIKLSKHFLSKELSESSIQLDLIFTNQGARRGFVEDIAIVVKTNGKQGIFRSLAEVTDRTIEFQKELVPPKLESFIGVQLGKYESSPHLVYFIPFSGSEIVQLSEGAYVLDLWIKSTESQNWIKKDSLKFHVNSEDIISLNKSKIIPQPDGRLYISLMQQDKALSYVEDRLKKLSLIIANNDN